ncbi:hypothetical protein CR513_23819, partial [Mucuna pruriens]
MDLETCYCIWKLRPILTKTPDLQSLRLWGSCLKGQLHRTFEGRYDNLLSLLEIEVQLAALSALTQYYDPPLKCFAFKDFQLAPTLEDEIPALPSQRTLSMLGLSGQAAKDVRVGGAKEKMKQEWPRGTPKGQH